MDARETAIGDEKTSGEAMTVRSPESSYSAGPEPEGMGSGSGDARFGEGRMPDDRADRGRRSRRRAERPKKKGSFWRELPILVVLALGLALLIKTFLIQAFYIPSESMENTLVPGDRVLVNKLSYRFGEIQRGDVIVFNGANSWEPEVTFDEPDNVVSKALRGIGQLFGFAPIGEKDFIKRVIGLPGDKVACCDDDGRVTVNGKPIEESDYLFPGDAPSSTPFEATVPEGRLWMMGDHRSASADSRMHLGDPGGGTIPIDHVIGRAFVIVWPLDRLDILSRPEAFVEAGVALPDDPAAAEAAATARPTGARPVDAGTAALAVLLPLVGLVGWRRRSGRHGRR